MLDSLSLFSQAVQKSNDHPAKAFSINTNQGLAHLNTYQDLISLGLIRNVEHEKFDI